MSLLSFTFSTLISPDLGRQLLTKNDKEAEMKKQPHIQNPFNSLMSNTTHVVEHIKSAENIIKQSLHKKTFESGIKTTVNAFFKS